MAININSIITWADYTGICYNAIINACCNIDTYKGVPLRLQAGQGAMVVKKQTTGIPSSQATQTFSWSATPNNLIDLVTSDIVNQEWSSFLTAAGIDFRSNKLIQARDMGFALGLYQQFMSFHLKPVYSRRQAYNTTESQTLFQGVRYITGICVPKYTLEGIAPDAFPEVTNDDIVSIIRQSIIHDGVNYGMLDSENNPVIPTCKLS